MLNSASKTVSVAILQLENQKHWQASGLLWIFEQMVGGNYKQNWGRAQEGYISVHFIGTDIVVFPHTFPHTCIQIEQ